MFENAAMILTFFSTSAGPLFQQNRTHTSTNCFRHFLSFSDLKLGWSQGSKRSTPPPKKKGRTATATFRSTGRGCWIHEVFLLGSSAGMENPSHATKQIHGFSPLGGPSPWSTVVANLAKLKISLLVTYMRHCLRHVDAVNSRLLGVLNLVTYMRSVLMCQC